MRLERAKPEDAQECMEWMTANKLNDLSPRTMKGSVFYKIPGVLYLPVKLVIMLDSIGPNPHADGYTKGLALIRAVKDLKKMYPRTELIFLSDQKGVLEHAAQKLCGFEPSGYVCYRLIDHDGKTQGTTRGSLAQIQLRNDARAIRRTKGKAARIVSHLLSTAGRQR